MTATELFTTSVPAAFWRGLDACVHCGFCLPACPTYEITADEADSPRGRIELMRALERGELTPDDEGLRHHLGRCLDCRACETVCPSAVTYGPALEAARAAIAGAVPAPTPVRLLLRILASRGLQNALWLLARVVRATGLPRVLSRGAGADAPRVAWTAAMLAASGGTGTPHRPAHAPAAAGSGSRARVQLFTGCVQSGLFGHVHEATATALRHNDLDVGAPAGQVCCGALAAHAGDAGLARRLALANLRAFAGATGAIVVNAAGCGAMLKHYAALLAGEPAHAAAAREFSLRVRDVSEVLAERGPAPGNPLPLRVAYDAPCHLVHAQKLSREPLALLKAIPGIELVVLDEADRCCGAAGLYSLVEPELSAAVLARKLDAVRRVAPDVVATGNPGCQMQLGAGILLSDMDVDVRHPVELLAWSYEAPATTAR